ncbi:hypothetical protein Taro_035930 [Colocasia esculenta]|uniref:Uncharacterized protein n=1 Tax=Colocasia esculenta TaxID=4460 RepID=A0A843WER2_COLES|nr:hypothetical protein [Colocasia esculenta]
MTSLSVRPSVYRQVLEAQQADSGLTDILQMPDVELDEDSEDSLHLYCQPCGGHDVQSYRVSDRETSQQRQGACQAEETGW